MKDELTSLIRQKRKVEHRVTNENKDKIIKEINKSMGDFGYSKIPKNATVQQVNNFKKEYLERITYDIVSLAVQEGKDIVAEVEARDLRKSYDFESKRLGEFAKDLARAKKESNRNLTKEEKQFLERGNNNIKGYGNEDIITLFEKAKNKKEVQALIKSVKEQDPKNIFYEKQNKLFENVFQKVGIYREKDINKIKERINNMNMQDALNYTNDLLHSLEMFSSDQENVGSSGDETELANARLDDMLIRMNIKKTGKAKVQKVLSKYK